MLIGMLISFVSIVEEKGISNVYIVHCVSFQNRNGSKKENDPTHIYTCFELCVHLPTQYNHNHRAHPRRSDFFRKKCELHPIAVHVDCREEHSHSRQTESQKGRNSREKFA
jgi:hypothetical protein